MGFWYLSQPQPIGYASIPRNKARGNVIEMTMADYEIGRCTRHCAASGRELAPGEEYYAALVDDGQNWSRLDFAAEAWQGPPEGCVAWWKSRVPSSTKRPGWAPSEVMLHLLDELADRADRADMRFVLALFLVRRRMLRDEGYRQDDAGREVLVAYSPKHDKTWEIPVATPSEERIQAIQTELTALLHGDAEIETPQVDAPQNDAPEDNT